MVTEAAVYVEFREGLSAEVAFSREGAKMKESSKTVGKLFA